MPKNIKKTSEFRKWVGGKNKTEKLKIYAEYILINNDKVFIYYYASVRDSNPSLAIITDKKKLDEYINNYKIIRISDNELNYGPSLYDNESKPFFDETLSDQKIELYEQKIEEKKQEKKEKQEKENQKVTEGERLKKILEDLVLVKINYTLYGLKGDIYINKNDEIKTNQGFDIKKTDITYIISNNYNYEKLNDENKHHFEKEGEFNDNLEQILYKVIHDDQNPIHELDAHPKGGKRKNTRKNKQQKKRRTYHRRR